MSTAVCGVNGVVPEQFYNAAQQVVGSLHHSGAFMGYGCKEAWIDCGSGRIVRVAVLSQCPFPENNFVVEAYRLGFQGRLLQTDGSDTNIRLSYESMVAKVQKQGRLAQEDLANKKSRAKRGEFDLRPQLSEATKHDGTRVPLTPLSAMPSTLHYKEARPRPASLFLGLR